MDEIGPDAPRLADNSILPRLADNFDLRVARQDLLQLDLQLQLGEPVSDATVNAKGERQMLARPRPVDDEVVWIDASADRPGMRTLARRRAGAKRGTSGYEPVVTPGTAAGIPLDWRLGQSDADRLLAHQ